MGNIKKIGVLTGGGDCPGLNAAIRAVVKKGLSLGYSFIGIRNGWRGLIKGEVEPLTNYSVTGILHRGGTILGSSRTNPFKNKEDVQRCLDNLKKFEIEAIIAIGGEDTLGVADKFFQEGVKVVGIPKTIDNDLSCTDYTFGFDTAVTIATEAIDRLHTTAEAHNRVIVVEVMGRYTGWIATYAGIAGGADCIIIPEKPFELNKVSEIINKRHSRGREFSIIVIAEGAKPKLNDKELSIERKEKDAFGHIRLGGIGSIVADEIEKLTKIETRVTILGYVQRGGTPTAFDRILATRYGLAAIDYVNKNLFGKMAALQGNKIVPVDIKDAVGAKKYVDIELYEEAGVFFG